MAQIFRWLMRIAGGLVGLALLALLGVYFFASRSLPDYDRTVDVRGITGPVEIVRDNANVPHIFGDSDADVFFGLGYAHAQDRLWQMTMMRRTAQGRLSELFGEATLGIDSFLRRLDIYRLAQASVAVQDEYTGAALRAYAAGVNTRRDQINSEALGRGAPEMFLFNAPIAPWVPADSLAIIKLMGLRLSGHLEEEVLRARVSLALEDESRLADILPDHPGAGIAVLPEYSELFPTLRRHASASIEDRHPLDPVVGEDEAFEYRLLMVLAYTIFLVAAVVRRILQPMRRSASAGQRRQSVFGEARMQADTCVPFAFMG